LTTARAPDAGQRLTHLNDDVLRHLQLSQVDEIGFDSGGSRIQGWVVKPPDFDPARRYPLLLEIHGGPYGVDTVIQQGSVDQSHMFVGGCSNGGVLSSWVISHTDRFAAAAVRCPVTNWVSMGGQTDIPFFTNRFFARPYCEDPSDWLAESTLMHVGNVKTPTLLMTGERPPHTHRADRRELRGAEIARRAHRVAAVRR
jgi:dipeptidyl aminopeptidase/acylaminoacyl peptidase